jgi:hypothetical protein
MGRKMNMQERTFTFKTLCETMNVSLNNFNSHAPDGHLFMSPKTSFNAQDQCLVHPGLEGLLLQQQKRTSDSLQLCGNG